MKITKSNIGFEGLWLTLLLFALGFSERIYGQPASVTFQGSLVFPNYATTLTVTLIGGNSGIEYFSGSYDGGGPGGGTAQILPTTLTLLVGDPVRLTLAKPTDGFGGSSFTITPDDGCHDVHITDDSVDLNEDGYTAYEDPGDDTVICIWGITITTNIGSIKLDACHDQLPADSRSTTIASLDYAIHPPVTWTLPYNPPHCRIVATNANGYQATIAVSNIVGTVTILATDAYGCSVRKNLDVVHPGTSCGGSICAASGGPASFGTPTFDLGSLNFSIGLGAGIDGRDAGQLLLYSQEITAELYYPGLITYPWIRPNVTLITGQTLPGGQHIRQLRVPQGLVDIAPGDPYSDPYVVRCYPSNQVGSVVSGLYSVSGTPIATWTLENPDNHTATNRLKITESRPNQSDKVYIYKWLTNGWELNSVASNRIEQVTTAWTTNGNPFHTDTRVILNSSLATVESHSKKYELMGLGIGEHLVEEVDGTGPGARTNSYTYYTNGLVRQSVRADGPWEYFTYDSGGRPTNVFSTFGNQGPTTNSSLCRMLVYSYASSAVSASGDIEAINAGSPRLTMEYIKDQPVSRRFQVFLPTETRDIVCLSSDAAWDNASNLVTVTTYYTNGWSYGKPSSVKHPDGTMDFYYYPVTNAIESSIIVSGQTNGGGTAISVGISNVTVATLLGQTISSKSYDVASGILLSSETYSEFDSIGRAKKVTYLDGTSKYTEYTTCCGEQVVTNREGTVTTYVYDALNRLVSTTANSITESNIYNAAGKVTKRQRVSGASSITLEQLSYDDGGRPYQRIDAVGNYTAFTRSIDGSGQLALTKYTTNVGTAVSEIETLYRDGKRQSLTGNGVHPARYEYGATNGGMFTTEIKMTSTTDLAESSVRLSDFAEREWQTLFSDGAYSQSIFATNGQLLKQADPDGVTTIYAYSSQGQQEVVATRVDTNNASLAPDFAGTDRIQKTISTVLNNGSYDVLRRSTYVWPTRGSDVSNLVSVVETSTDGLHTWSSLFGLTNRTDIRYTGSGHRYITNTAPDGTVTLSHYQHGQLKDTTRSHPFLGQLSATTSAYDALGRQITSTDARNGAITYTYYDDGRTKTVTTPAPGTGGAPQTTAYQYDAFGRPTQLTLPDSSFVYSKYASSGELTNTYGSRTYPCGLRLRFSRPND